MSIREHIRGPRDLTALTGPDLGPAPAMAAQDRPAEGPGKEN
ncbi:hypothetical protein ACWD0A_10885 [Streptomyces sp. NPDC002867]